jgi:RHS repeat-associated protein
MMATPGLNHCYRPDQTGSRKEANMDSPKKTHTRIKLLPAMVLAALSLAGRVAHASGTTLTQYTYDAGDHIATVIDPRGLVTTYTHDGLGLFWQQVSPDTGTTSFAYDAYGRKSSMTRADLTQTTYGYDGLNRPTSVSAGGLTQSFAYDTCTNGLGRLCSDSDATGATTYTYTPEGWVAGRGFSMGSTTYALGYGYDPEGHLASVNYPDNNQANYTYTNGVVSSVTLKVGGTQVNGATAITYQPMNMGMASWTSSNGLSNTMSYDTDARLTGISVPGVQSLGFTYDNANRITQIGNGIDGNLTQNFGYDAMSRLLSVYSGDDNESFQYDASGNRIVQTGTTDTISPTSNQLASSGAISYGYDAKGNTTTVSGVPTYSYDPFNRMVGANGATYYVNPEGQRLSKQVSGVSTYFAPDSGNHMLAESVSGGWSDYVWLNGRLIGRMAGGQVYAIDDDQVGRPEEVTNASQAIVWRAQNFPFTQNVIVSTVTLNLGFPGQYYDAETAAWNNGYRDYKSGLGRYVESDPIGLNGGPSTYMYADGNPIAWTDVFGLRADTDLCAGLSANGCMQIGQAYGPDYVTFNVNLPSLLTVAYTLTRDGSIYHHAGLGVPSKGSMNGKWGFNLSFGKMLTGCDTDNDIDQFVNGMSGSAGFYDGAGFGGTVNQNGAAMEVGVGIGGVSAQGSGAAPAGRL